MIETGLAKMRLFRVPEFLATAFLLGVLGMLVRFSCWSEGLMPCPFASPDRQPLRGRCILLIAFAMLSQRRILTLIHLFARQGVGARRQHRHGRLRHGASHLYFSAVLTVVLKVILLPYMLCTG